MNEIDICLGRIFLREMRIADPRNILRNQDTEADPEKKDWLWDESRVFQVDELDTEEIFNTYLLRQKLYGKPKDVNVSYPILAYMQEDIKTVFWGTGNRYHQWYLDIPVDTTNWTINDEVVITAPVKYRGFEAEIVEIHPEGMQCILKMSNQIIQERDDKGVWRPVLFNFDDLRQITPGKLPEKYKAKSITGTYTSVILTDNRDELQYIRDKFILRVADGEIWFKYESPMLHGAENQVFTVFGIPNINKYTKASEKIQGEGYIYGASFTTNIWAALTDTPFPSGFFDTIRMNLTVDREDKVNRIVIN